MGKNTTLYEGTVVLKVEQLLFLIKTADALDEIGATEQAEAIRYITQFLSRREINYETQ